MPLNLKGPRALLTGALICLGLGGCSAISGLSAYSAAPAPAPAPANASPVSSSVASSVASSDAPSVAPSVAPSDARSVSSSGVQSQPEPAARASEVQATRETLQAIPQTPRYENLIDRITAGFSMPELNSPLVATHERWIQRNPQYLNRVFERGGKYLHHIVEELEARNLPTELALLPIVESAFNPQALSRAKAAGLWQFIPSTGKAFDLQQDWWLDQRRDVIESTRAALDYLQKIYELQDNDWFLALASYNWGEGAVLRARKRNEAQRKPTDYLSLKMPKETQNYVPKLIALRNVLSRPAEFGVSLPQIENKPYFVIIDKEQSIDLKLAAAFADMTVEEFTELNPSHHRPVISASRTNRIVLPAERAQVFQTRLAAHLDSGKPLVSWKPYTLKADETITSLAKKVNLSVTELIKANSLKPNAKPLPGTVLLAPVMAQTDEPSIETTLAKFSGTRIIERETVGPLYHRVRNKETLAAIARRYGVTQDTIRSLNQLSGEIELGMRLLIRPAHSRTILTNEYGIKQVIATPKASEPQKPASPNKAQGQSKQASPKKTEPKKTTAPKTAPTATAKNER